jgi:Mce-associated membrane protein
MTAPTSPSWYDLLDVPPDATEGEIKAAWKAAIADLDPTDRKFRVLNQAAEVLLDAPRRAAYDAELAEAERAELAEIDETDAAQAPAPEAGPPAYVAPVVDGVVAPQRPGVPGWLLAVVAALTAVAVGACVFVWTNASPDESLYAGSTRAAQSAAERAIVPILSYNALHLDEDQKAAESYMTASYRKDYDDLFAVIKQNAPATKTIVRAEVLASGVVRSGKDRVDVLLFVNRPTTNKQLTEPVVYKDQVTVTMQLVDGDWLVDDLVTTPVSQ